MMRFDGLVMKKIGIEILVIGSCVIMLAAGSISASAADPGTGAGSSGVTSSGSTGPGNLTEWKDNGAIEGNPTSIQPALPANPGMPDITAAYGSKELYELHLKIDDLVFEQHHGEFKEQGFRVTNTGPADGMIEIGILPYTEENAKYLYQLFGKDLVKVVEGIDAVPLTDKQKTSVSSDVQLMAGQQGDYAVAAVDAEDLATVRNRNPTGNPPLASKASQGIGWVLVGVLVALLVILTGRWLIRRKRLT